jgi:hypothetical protein
MDMLQDVIFHEMRRSLGDKAPILDEFQFESDDPAQSRYR